VGFDWLLSSLLDPPTDLQMAANKARKVAPEEASASLMQFGFKREVRGWIWCCLGVKRLYDHSPTIECR
jgi:hypothetical protein